MIPEQFVDLDELREAILASENIESCPKPPLPKMGPNQNYVFISYSHKDYKSVYCDLVELLRAGVRFWYDEGLPAGKKWDEVVEEKIQSPSCGGVVFYMSESLFLSRSIILEIGLTVGEKKKDGAHVGGRNYFCVNIAGKSPTHIIADIYKTREYHELELMGFPDHQPTLAVAFTDKATYIPKDTGNPGSVLHIAKVVEQMAEQFNVIDAIEDFAAAPFADIYHEYGDDFLVEGKELVRYNGNDADVYIPEGIRTIGMLAFGSNKKLEIVHLPQSVTEIGMLAFNGCINLVSVDLPDSLHTIGPSAFCNCFELKDVTLPSSLREIGQLAFSDCSSLRSIAVPEGITAVADYTFSGCLSLESVTLPSTLRHIGKGAFSMTDKLTRITLPEGVTTVDEDAFCSIGLKEINLPEGIVRIGNGAFRSSGLTNIRIPESVTKLGSGVFHNCTELSHVEYCTDADIPEKAFSGCGCDGFTLTVTGAPRSIGDEAFSGCAVEQLEIPESVTRIGHHVFCRSRFTEIIVPQTVEEIGRGAFDGIGTLKKVLWQSPCPIPESGFSGCKALTDVTIEGTATAIGALAFWGCGALSGLTVKSPIATVHRNAFGWCGLTSVTLPDSVTRIASGAFRQCAELREFTYPRSLTQIEDYVFDECTALENVYMLFDQRKLYNGKLPKDCRVIYTDVGERAEEIAAEEAKKQAADERRAESAERRRVAKEAGLSVKGDVVVGRIGKGDSVVLPGFIREIGKDALFRAYSGDVSHIKLNDGLKIIGEGGLAWQKFETIDIPERVEEIRDGAFSGCENLKAVKLPRGLRVLGQYAFSKCTALGCVEVPEGIEELSARMFCECRLLSDVTLPSNIKKIGKEAFAYCGSLETLMIPEGVVEIEEEAFMGCHRLREVIFLGTPEKIGDKAFSYCRSLKKIAFPDGIREIGSQVFWHCDELKEVRFGRTLEKAGYSIFKDCPKLRLVEYPEAVGILNYTDVPFLCRRKKLK